MLFHSTIIVATKTNEYKMDEGIFDIWIIGRIDV